MGHGSVATRTYYSFVSSRERARKMLDPDYRRSSLLDLEAVFLGTEEEAGITFRVRSVGVQIDLEAVRLIPP
jgi:hypothetical protein